MLELEYIYLRQEVDMWRRRYIADKKVSKQVKSYFFSAPSHEIFDKNPESTLEMCKYVENMLKIRKK